MSTTTAPAAQGSLMEFRAEHTLASRHRLAMQDVHNGLRLLPLGVKLGWLDILLRYRGSTLGPFWLTLSTGMLVAGLGYLYAGIFHTDTREYLPFLALSLVLWAFISAVMTDACTAFIEADSVLRSIRMPLSLFAVRVLVRNTLVLAHNILVIVVVYAIFTIWPGWNGLLVLPGLALWAIDALALVLLLGAFAARFRDMPPILNSLMQIAFFVTPVIWEPAQVGGRQMFLPLNPFFDLLEIVRAPLLGARPDANAWIGALAFSALLLAIGWGFFVRARGRVAFWI